MNISRLLMVSAIIVTFAVPAMAQNAVPKNQRMEQSAQVGKESPKVEKAEAKSVRAKAREERKEKKYKSKKNHRKHKGPKKA